MTDFNDYSTEPIDNSNSVPASENPWSQGLGLAPNPSDSPLGVPEAQNVYNRVLQTGTMLTGMRMGAAMAAGQPPESFWSQNNGQLYLGVPDPMAHPFDQTMNPLFHRALAPLHNNTLDAVEQYQQLQQTNPNGNFDQAEQIMSDARALAQNNAHLYGAWNPATFYALAQGNNISSLPPNAYSFIQQSQAANFPRPATLHIWEPGAGSVTKNSYGHSALTLGDGTYISNWPQDNMHSLLQTSPMRPPNYDQDVKDSGRTPIDIPVYFLDQQAVKNWWQNHDCKDLYNPANNNCSTTISEALRQGGMPILHGVFWDNPLQVKNNVNALIANQWWKPQASINTPDIPPEAYFYP